MDDDCDWVEMVRFLSVVVKVVLRKMFFFFCIQFFPLIGSHNFSKIQDPVNLFLVVKKLTTTATTTISSSLSLSLSLSLFLSCLERKNQRERGKKVKLF